MSRTEQRLAWALAACARAGLRLTGPRQAILRLLAGQPTPLTLVTVARGNGVQGRCDVTTVYRTLRLFQAAGVVRLVGTTQRAASFALNVPGACRGFLICRSCGKMVSFALPKVLTAELTRVAARHGFSAGGVDVELHGVCARCHAAQQRQLTPSKLAATTRLRCRATDARQPQ